MAKKTGQPFAMITDGDFVTLSRLGRNAGRAGWLLAVLRRKGGAGKYVEMSVADIAEAAGMARAKVYDGIRDLLELGLIRVVSGDKHGRKKICNAYQLLDPPIIRCTETIHQGSGRCMETIQQISGNHTTDVRKPDDGCMETELPIRNIDNNREVDILDMEEKAEDSCLGEVKRLLKIMGIVNAKDRNGYGLEIVTGGLTDEDVESAMKIATFKVGSGQVGQLGGVKEQGAWTKGLQLEALKYARGIINRCIAKGTRVVIPAEVAAGVAEIGVGG